MLSSDNCYIDYCYRVIDKSDGKIREDLIKKY